MKNKTIGSDSISAQMNKPNKHNANSVGAGLAFGKNEELIVNNEEYKCCAFDVGAGPVSAQNINKTSINANTLQINKQSAITLIALIITIIIMLILAGVVLNLTLGEHGIFKTAINAGEEYEKSQIKEEIEMAIMDIQSEKTSIGEELSLKDLASNEQLLKKKLPDILVNLSENKIIGIYKEYSFEILENFDVKINSMPIADIKGETLIFEDMRVYTETTPYCTDLTKISLLFDGNLNHVNYGGILLVEPGSSKFIIFSATAKVKIESYSGGVYSDSGRLVRKRSS